MLEVRRHNLFDLGVRFYFCLRRQESHYLYLYQGFLVVHNEFRLHCLPKWYPKEKMVDH